MHGLQLLGKFNLFGPFEFLKPRTPTAPTMLKAIGLVYGHNVFTGWTILLALLTVTKSGEHLPHVLDLLIS